MLVPARFFKDELEHKLAIAYEDPFYKYYFADIYIDYDVDNTNSTWNAEKYVSVDSNNNVIGYLAVNVDRSTHTIGRMRVVNFGDKSLLFAKDFNKFIYKMLVERGYFKLSFAVVIGNPAEAIYDKFVERYGGRIVGVCKEDVLLAHNDTVPPKRYDLKLYEIKGEDFYNNFIKLKGR